MTGRAICRFTAKHVPEHSLLPSTTRRHYAAIWSRCNCLCPDDVWNLPGELARAPFARRSVNSWMTPFPGLVSWAAGANYRFGAGGSARVWEPSARSEAESTSPRRSTSGPGTAAAAVSGFPILTQHSLRHSWLDALQFWGWLCSWSAHAEAPMPMPSSYHPSLATLSLVVAILASYTALDLSGRV